MHQREYPRSRDQDYPASLADSRKAKSPPLVLVSCPELQVFDGRRMGPEGKILVANRVD